MNIQALTPNMIRKLGVEALAKALGPVGMVRFLQQYEEGAGDYTGERGEWLKDYKVTDIMAEIKKKAKV